MKRILFIFLALPIGLTVNAQKIDLDQTEAFSPYIFGHNLEHTRSAVNSGLSAQMLKNRKFAGKPQANQGICMHWRPIGEKVLFIKSDGEAYTKHICLPNMHRGNERSAQVIQNLREGQTVGIGQDGIAVESGRTYELRTVTRVSKPVSLKVELSNISGNKVYASHVLSLTPADDWVISSFELTPSTSDSEACIRYTFTEQAELLFGALSLMPKDNFHGLRLDVVENLKQIGPRLIRWPGGNFAGEYRWKDGLLHVDQRAPLQSATEIETQPHSDGYDFHEINTDDFIALCREVGAEPMLTINLAWQSPEESAQWVEYCNGAADSEYGKLRADRGHPEPYNVHFWSLGNEMGYGHMEGPNNPKSYTEYALRHTEAMLKVSPSLELFASGPYPNDEWAENSAAAMAEKVPYISLHQYLLPAGGIHYESAEATRKTYEGTVKNVFALREHAQNMRKSLDNTGKKLHISFDEWNQWYAWYRPSCVSEGIFTARVLHFMLLNSNALDMPVACYFQPVGEGAIIVSPIESRLTANGQMFAMMKVHQDGRLCRIEENDDLSTAATLHGDTLTITLINEQFDSERTFSFALRGKVLDATLYDSADVLPYSYFTERPLGVTIQKKGIQTVLPPHSAAMIMMKIEGR